MVAALRRLDKSCIVLRFENGNKNEKTPARTCPTVGEFTVSGGAHGDGVDNIDECGVRRVIRPASLLHDLRAHEWPASAAGRPDTQGHEQRIPTVLRLADSGKSGWPAVLRRRPARLGRGLCGRLLQPRPGGPAQPSVAAL